MAESNAPWHELLVELLDPQPGERFLDVGTGSGGVAVRAAARGARAVGIDVSQEAIEQARAAAPDVEFVVGDAEALPFDDASFDAVASAYGVNFARNHARAAAELARVTRPGGRAGLTVMPRDSRAAAVWTLVRDYHSDGDHPGEWSAELLEPWFDVEVYERESEPTERFTPEERWQFSVEHIGFVREVVLELGDAERERFRRRFLELAAEYEDRPLRSLVILGRRR